MLFTDPSLLVVGGCSFRRLTSRWRGCRRQLVAVLAADPWPVFEYQSWVKVASWLRSIAQKNALLIVWPRSVDAP